MTTPRLLIAEDSADMRESLKLLLEREGYVVAVAADGACALELQRRQPADVLITDIFMPDRDGIETIQEFRHEFPRVRIIAMSGGGARVGGRYLDIAELAGADAVLRKPFEVADLLRTLKDLGAV